jgi:stringent starvation protein B
MTLGPAPPEAGGQGSSTRPYLVRALHEWCTDNGFTPYIAVLVDADVNVPTEYVKNGEIVLNIGFEATTSLKLGNDFIEFKARFGGASRDISVPVDHVIAIYARENGQGMAFPVPTARGAPSGGSASEGVSKPVGLRLASGAAALDEPQSKQPPGKTDDPQPEPPPIGGRPALKRIK